MRPGASGYSSVSVGAPQPALKRAASDVIKLAVALNWGITLSGSFAETAPGAGCPTHPRGSDEWVPRTTKGLVPLTDSARRLRELRSITQGLERWYHCGILQEPPSSETNG